ncbi:MAG TPA: GNAT family N-acetyltransferase [Chloroflexota bacterium]|nr:GNAT family N-acetyltransferase [Chloroflexota bacterium]
MNLTIGPMTEQDLEGAAAAIASGPVFQRYGLDQSSAVALLRAADGRIFVAKVGGEVAGVAVYWTEGTMPVPAYLRILAVAEGKRGLGIGRALLRQVEADAYRRGPNIFLCCEITNVEARRLYEREGYVEVGPLPNFIAEGITEVLFRKTLGPIRGYVRPS